MPQDSGYIVGPADPYSQAPTPTEQLIAQSAEADRQVAVARTEAAATEVGTSAKNLQYVLPPAARVLGQSDNVTTTIDPDTGQTILDIRPTRQRRQVAAPVQGVLADNQIEKDTAGRIDPAQITLERSRGLPGFDIDKELSRLSTLEGEDRIRAGEMLLGSLTEQAGKRQAHIRDLAAVRAGVRDAENNLNKIIALENAGKAAGRIPPGETTYQKIDAQEALYRAQQIANQMEADMVKSDPMLLKYEVYGKRINQDFKFAERALSRRDSLEARLPPLDGPRTVNLTDALGLDPNEKGVSLKLGNALLKDKALQKIVDADKFTLPSLITDDDQRVRQMAYKIIVANEKRMPKYSGELPSYVKEMEKYVANPELALTPEAKKKMELDQGMVSGANEKRAIRLRAYATAVEARIAEVARNKYKNMNSWTFSNPQMRAVIDDLVAKTKDPDKKILLSDGIAAIVSAPIKKPDGTDMSFEEKRAMLVTDSAVTIGNDRDSFILPNVADYGSVMATEVRQAATRAYINNARTTGAFFIPLPGAAGVGAGAAYLERYLKDEFLK